MESVIGPIMVMLKYLGINESRFKPTPVGAKIQLPLFKNKIDYYLRAIGIAERLKGSPPSTPEIIVAYRDNFPDHLFMIIGVMMILNDLYRADMFYADKKSLYYSLNLDGPTDKKDFELYS